MYVEWIFLTLNKKFRIHMNFQELKCLQSCWENACWAWYDVSKILNQMSKNPFFSDSDTECLRFPDGMEYRGTVSQTADGQQCNYWNESALPLISPELVYIVGANQYCRSPVTDSQLGSPWCFTDYFYIGMCDITFCGKLFEYDFFRMLRIEMWQWTNNSDISIVSGYEIRKG